MHVRTSRRWVLLASLAILGACGRVSPDQPSESTREDVRCSLGGECTASKSRVTAKQAPRELGAEIRVLGPGLPLAITEKGYRDLLAGTRVVRKGAHAGAAGPVAMSAVAQGDELQVSVQVAPIPNLEAFADKVGSGMRLQVTSVKDQRGQELLDPTNPLVSDAVHQALRLEREPSMFAASAGDQQTTIDAVRVPGSEAVDLYATRSIPLKQTVASGQLGVVEGTLELSLPVAVSALEQRGKQWTLTQGEVAVEGTLDASGRNLTLSVTRGAELLVAEVAKNRAGAVLESTRDFQTRDEASGKVTIERRYDDEVATVSVVLAERVLRHTYPFTLQP